MTDLNGHDEPKREERCGGDEDRFFMALREKSSLPFCRYDRRLNMYQTVVGRPSTWNLAELA